MSGQNTPAAAALLTSTSPSSTIEIAKTFHKTPALVCHRVRCGKPICHCVEGQGHGPYWVLRWREGATQRRRYVRQADVEAVRVVVEARHRDDRQMRRAVILALADLRRVRTWLRDLETA